MVSLLLTYFLTQSGVGDAPPISPIGRRDSSSCSDLDTCRTTSDVIWSCLVTIFLCTWVAVHPNIEFTPDDDQDISWLDKRLRNPIRRFLGYKFPLFLCALFVPEYVLAWAIRQYLRAGEIQKQVPGWTRTHGFFMIMGGFHLFRVPADVSSVTIPPGSSNISEFILPLHHSYQDELPDCPLRLEDLPVDVLNAITPTETEIQDRGKSDGIGKAIVLAQTSWFVIQCVARGIRHLPLTELEVVTLAYATVNFFIYIFWWHKPRDVGCPIRVYKKLAASEGKEQYNVARAKTIVTGTKVMAYLLGVQDVGVKLSQERRVPMFWSDMSENGSDLTGDAGLAFVGPSILGMGFGAIHCIVWSATFPSYTELVLWRTSCIAMIAIPLFATLSWGPAILLGTPNGDVNEGLLAFVLSFLGMLFLTAWLYIVARIATILIALTTLRAIPPEALTVVDWTTYIPHI